jgi:predicted dithiol-disulfide oxidoreductase (DUF899 family)
MSDDASSSVLPIMGVDGDLPLPEVVDRADWQKRLDELLVKEKAHTRAGDALAAERRRLPMVEVDSSLTLTSTEGRQVTLLDVFEGRKQLLAYFSMWHDGKPAAEQCEGCSFFNGQVRDLSFLHSRGITYATFCQGPYDQLARYRDFMGWPMPWYETGESTDALIAGRYFGMLVAYVRDGDRVFETYWRSGRGTEVMAPTYGLMDLSLYGRQEMWEDSPEGWPKRWRNTGEQFRTNGRPTAQWERLASGHSDNLKG